MALARSSKVDADRGHVLWRALEEPELELHEAVLPSPERQPLPKIIGTTTAGRRRAMLLRQPERADRALPAPPSKSTLLYLYVYTY